MSKKFNKKQLKKMNKSVSGGGESALYLEKYKACAAAKVGARTTSLTSKKGATVLAGTKVVTKQASK